MKAKKNAVVCVSNDLATDNRVAKTCDVLEELDYQVVLIGRKSFMKELKMVSQPQHHW